MPPLQTIGMMMRPVRTPQLLLFAAAVLLAGCGRQAVAKREYAEVTGKITFKGKAVPKGNILFQPDVGESASGEISSDGKYRVRGVVGTNRVIITSRDADDWIPKPEKTGSAPKASAPPPGYMPPKSSIPDIYSGATSPLSFEIKPGTNSQDFDLEDLSPKKRMK